MKIKPKLGLALAGVVLLGFVGGELIASTPRGDDKVTPIQVKPADKSSSQARSLDRAIDNMRRSAHQLSLPNNIFEPWWQTMMHDPDAASILRNWDSLNNDPDRIWSITSAHSSARDFGFAPRVDIAESDKDVRLTAEVPGLDEKSLEVSADNDTVTIEGTKSQEKLNKNGGFQSIERSYGSFSRMVHLPCRVLGDKATASLKDGVLTVTLPKAAEAKERNNKITIKRE